MICPIMSRRNEQGTMIGCEGRLCALYDEKVKQCCIKTLAQKGNREHEENT